MFPRIESNVGVLSGKPCIRGTRISVSAILELAASGASPDEIAAAYPHLSREDVREAMRFAAQVLDNSTIQVPS